jgi:hypothetical protein
MAAVDVFNAQSLFLELVTGFMLRCNPRDAGRNWACTALALCSVGKNGRRQQLGTWGYRALHACEAECHRWAAERAGDAETVLSVIGRYIRSNTEIRTGPVEARVRELVYRFNVNAISLQAMRTDPRFRERVDVELARSRGWYRDVADDASTTTDEMSIDGDQ